MNLSFGWTAQLLPPNGCKDTTRRDWSKKHFEAWLRQWDNYPEKWHKSYDKCAAYGGKQIGWHQLKERPFLEKLLDMPKADVAREGHPEMNSPMEFIDHYFWKPKKSWTLEEKADKHKELLNKELAVVRFKFDPNPDKNPNYLAA